MKYDLAFLTSDPTVLRLLDASVGRIMTKNGEFNDLATLRHITDWLTASVVNMAPWLSNVDEAGVPKKLTKCSTMDGLVRQADRAMAAEAHKLRSARIADIPLAEGETVIERFADGFVLVEMTTPAALDRESAMMGHCVGNGSYDFALGHDMFLSLRDASGRSHVTMQIRKKDIRQFKGKENKAPLGRYVDILKPWISEGRFRLTESSNITGLVQDSISGALHSILEMPDGLVVDGSLDLGAVELKSLPRNLTVQGALNMSGSRLTSLPEGLVVHKTLDLDGSMMESVPEDLYVGHDLILSSTPIRRLPDGLRIAGSLNLSKSEIEELPDGFSTMGYLNLSHTRMKRLPDRLFVGGSLDLENCCVTELPTVLVVGADLDIRNTRISKLPMRLKVADNLLAQDSLLDELPEGLSLYGQLDISRTPMTSLPENMSIEGHLNFDGTAIAAFPEQIRVGCDVNCVGTPLEDMIFEQLTSGSTTMRSRDPEAAMARR